jgi:outer membrane protein assembly factor BamB
MNRLHAAATFVCALVAASCLGAAEFKPGEDWPQFRGPKRDGLSTETGLLKEWPTSGPSLTWKATGLGSGFSTVAIADGKIYTTGDRDNGCFLIALEQNSGKEVWATKIGETGQYGGYAGPRGTPTVDGKLLYCLGQHGDLICAETSDGKVVWKKNLPKDFGGRCGGWSWSESPLVDGEKLVVTAGGRDAAIVAFNKQTGAVLWKAAVPGNDPAAYSSIVIGNGGGVRQYVQLMGNGVVSVSDAGKFLWRYDGQKSERNGRGLFVGNTANIPTPIVQGDHVFCSAGYGKGGALLKLTKSGTGVTAQEVYFNQQLTNKHGGWVMIGDFVYGDRDDSGRPQCANWKTGKVVWERNGGKGGGSASVTYADGRLYFRYQNGIMTLVDASPDGFKERGSFKIPGQHDPSWPHPVVAGGKLYLREQDEVLCYDVKGQQ